MKNLISFLTLLIFILNISHNLFSAEANDGVSPDPVRDIDGNELTTGTNYYIASDFRPGGGVSLYPSANRTCTYGVSQLVFGQGLPVVFHNGGTDLGEVIRESTDLTISFAPGMLFCHTGWQVDEYDEAANNYFVVTGEATVNNQFQIRKDQSLDGYKFVFCPKGGPDVLILCTDVGIYVTDERVRRFALNSNFRFSTFSFTKA